MPIFDYPFKCPDGHSFNANAKRISRCPECGKRGTREFSASEKPDPIKEVVKNTTVRVLRQGRAKEMPVKKAAPKTPTKQAALKTAAPVKTAAKKVSLTATRTTRVPKGATAVVRRRPKQMAVSRNVTATKRPLWHQVAEAVKFW